jgi:Flp pilus assembly protein TadG
VVTSGFLKDESGAAMVELTIVVTLLFTLVLGFVDFGYAFYQWNAANKAVQVGARLAAVSDPVALHNILSTAALDEDLDGTAQAGDPIDADIYSISCTSTGCTGLADVAFDEDAFNLIFYGDDAEGDDRCQGAGDTGRPGMCDFFPGLQPEEVRIDYVATGLGYWTRPGGAVPTIQVSIEGHQFQFFFLSGLLSFSPITMPNMLSTITGEDLCTPGTTC